MERPSFQDTDEDRKRLPPRSSRRKGPKLCVYEVWKKGARLQQKATEIEY